MSPPRAALRALLALAAVALAAGAARADEPRDRWAEGEARPFASAQVDVGMPEHVALAVGWGRPHSMWGGVLAQGFLSTDFAAGRLGARLELQALALEAGVRFTRSFAHLPLPDLARHAAIPEGGGFDSTTVDLSASGGLPLGPGYALYEVLASQLVSSHGDGVQLYDELYRVVYKPSWVATASAGWVASLRDGALLAGGRVEWAFQTGRGGDPLVRVGPVVYWRLWPHLALAGEVRYPVSDPDAMGFADPVQAFLVLSFTAATGDRPPRFP